jgi:predicted AAA+ superfamily ATPase
MTAIQIKESLHDLINKIEDEELLNAYLKIIESGVKIEESEVVGYTPTGESITKAEMVETVRMASERVKSGKYISQEDLEKASDNW